MSNSRDSWQVPSFSGGSPPTETVVKHFVASHSLFCIRPIDGQCQPCRKHTGCIEGRGGQNLQNVDDTCSCTRYVTSTHVLFHMQNTKKCYKTQSPFRELNLLFPQAIGLFGVWEECFNVIRHVLGDRVIVWIWIWRKNRRSPWQLGRCKLMYSRF